MRRALSAIAILAAATQGCTLGPDYRAPSAGEAGVPQGWHAPLPHDGQVADLARWWTRFDDPLLAELVLAAQEANPTLAIAQARVREAQAVLRLAGAAQWPNVQGSASHSRNNGDGGLTTPAAGAAQTLQSATASAAFDLDLFGATRRSLEAGQARLEASEAAWHDARVGLAADVASTYVARRHCEALIAYTEADLDSRRAIHRLTGDKVEAGFSAPADGLRTEASVADGAGALLDLQGTCARTANLLAALTGIAMPELTARLAPHARAIPVPAGSTLTVVPAAALSQRPDVAAAERALAAASADIGVAIAGRYPRFTLAGSIGATRIDLAGVTASGQPWSFGPALTIPLFDGGAGAANVDAARARYDQALAAYQGQVRAAVQEVEDALVRVDTAVRRERAAEASDTQNQRYFASREAQYRLGAASLLELEDARRLSVASRSAYAAARLERAQAWIALYRAVGGGWQRTQPQSAALAAPPAPRPQEQR